MNNFFVSIKSPILALPRNLKRLVVIIVDVSVCFFSVWLAYYLRLNEFIILSEQNFIPVIISISLAIPIFLINGLYRTIFRYTGLAALLTVFRAVLIYGLIYAVIITLIGITDVPRTIGIIQPILLFLFISISRVIPSIWLGGDYLTILNKNKIKNVLIYGAGKQGMQLANMLEKSNEAVVIGFIDDDEKLHGNKINDLMVYSTKNINKIIDEFDISDLLLTIPKLTISKKKSIVNNIEKKSVHVRVVPLMKDIISGGLNISDIKEVDIIDLLGREPINPNKHLLASNIKNKVVLITGAGGSIGSELCREIIKQKPNKLLLLELNEYSLYKIYEELILKYKEFKSKIVPIIASVQDEKKLNLIFKQFKPYAVFHASAYKHVPLVELNAVEGIKNNVWGTLKTAKASINHNVNNFVLISTDKAVRPTNIMGASKRISEMILQGLSEETKNIKFSIVRFGNVLGSSGSVVPKFKKQIKDGGPITLTHRSITRFFMTINEASQLVIQASALGKSGQIFVLDMGEPIKIIDLAKKMVELSGLTLASKKNPDGDIKLKVIGLRSGEKIYEELLIDNKVENTMHPRIFIANDNFVPLKNLQENLHKLWLDIENNDIQKIYKLLEKIVDGYKASEAIKNSNQTK